jgi:hypothetical protein
MAASERTLAAMIGIRFVCAGVNLDCVRGCFSQNLDTVFPISWAHGKLQAMLDSGDSAETILKWIEENVSKDASSGEEFAQRLTRLFLEFVGARTKSISESDKVMPSSLFGQDEPPLTWANELSQVAEEETKLFEQYAPLLKKFLSEGQTQVDCLSVAQRFCFELDFPEGTCTVSRCARARVSFLTTLRITFRSAGTFVPGVQRC